MNLFIYCAGGFGKEIADTAKRINKNHNKWENIYFIDDFNRSGCDLYGTKSYHLDEAIRIFGKNQIVATVANGEPVARKAIYEKIVRQGIRVDHIIDDTSIISDTATIGEGSIITAHCSISSYARLENNVAINVKSIVGHDVTVGENSVISSMVNIGGATTIGSDSYIGMGVQIRDGIKIGAEVIIGMGSVVYGDIPDGVIALGNPARPMRKNEDKSVFKRI